MEIKKIYVLTVIEQSSYVIIARAVFDSIEAMLSELEDADYFNEAGWKVKHFIKGVNEMNSTYIYTGENFSFTVRAQKMNMIHYSLPDWELNDKEDK